ncbi:hypothetical protein KVR01_005015 [Diaporthe batatas]|uniref:uncharacterized protein n=1 Tax=Diaporthe batatas TaxID=748121 RepID=UPI001D05B941|nr:uncharacterized protein KVR01_005015 [Diaporthe batatas]KAG8164740.1 hypothetical protein KVR01_005015 [Diaporthe batatas]
MCLTIVTHFNRCSHRISTTTFCPRSIQDLPTIYHPPRPCVTNSREKDHVVYRDQLCDSCLKVDAWLAGGGGGGGGGGWPDSPPRRDDPSTRRKEKRREKDSAGRTTEGNPSSHRHHRSPGQRTSGRRQGVTAEPTCPVPTHAAHEDGGRCPLSEAFERTVRIEGDLGAPGPSDGWSLEEERAGDVSGKDLCEDEIEDAGIDHHSWTWGQRGEAWPFGLVRFPSDDGGSRPGGPRSRIDGHGVRSRWTRRRTAGRRKKQVRFARVSEMVRFRGDSATRTLGSLRREYKACR